MSDIKLTPIIENIEDTNSNDIDDIDEEYVQPSNTPVEAMPEMPDISDGELNSMMDKIKSMNPDDLRKIMSKFSKEDIAKLDSIKRMSNFFPQTPNNNDIKKPLTREELRQKLRQSCNMQRLKRSSKTTKEQMFNKLKEDDTEKVNTQTESIDNIIDNKTDISLTPNKKTLKNKRRRLNKKLRVNEEKTQEE